MAPATNRSPPSRLGFSLAPSRQLPPETIRDLAVGAERLGYDSLCIPETWGADAVSVLALVAAATGILRLASAVLNVYSRSAALIAQTAASLQNFSHGRFLLGLGTSGPIVVEGWHGVSFDRPLRRTREYVAVIRLALSGARVTYDGEILSLREFRLQNPPQDPVPIYLAALGRRNVELAGEIADGWLPIFAPRGQLAPLITSLHAGAVRAGRDPAEIDVAACLPVALGPRAERLLRQQLAYYIGGMRTFYADFLTRLGFGAPVQDIRTLWRAGRRLDAAASVADDLLDLCTLGGDATTAGARLEEYRREGVKLPILAFPHGATADEVVATLRALAPATGETASSRIRA